ncbi:MAG TPA: hypothetical protein VK742_20465 [Candidatus Sulfotelmatobacter sp.]|jgi:hypothetical protein|nr:hypothetical protein [Candidatus Sulfotelmatobacter sp.]
MITKTTIVCDGCKQPVDKDHPALIELAPTGAGVFLKQTIGQGDKTAVIEHRIINAVHLHNPQCFAVYCENIVATALTADKIESGTEVEA